MGAGRPALRLWMTHAPAARRGRPAWCVKYKASVRRPRTGKNRGQEAVGTGQATILAASGMRICDMPRGSSPVGSVSCRAYARSSTCLTNPPAGRACWVDCRRELWATTARGSGFGAVAGTVERQCVAPLPPPAASFCIGSPSHPPPPPPPPPPPAHCAMVCRPRYQLDHHDLRSPWIMHVQPNWTWGLLRGLYKLGEKKIRAASSSGRVRLYMIFYMYYILTIFII
jgi:hypothetical protein